jgi:hypothetical protein
MFSALGVPQGLHKPLAYVGGALLVVVLCGALWLRGNHYRGQRDEARATVAEMKAAQVLATAAQIELNRQVQAKSREIARVHDEATQALADARARAARYADAHVVRFRPSPARKADPAGTDGPAEDHNGPGADAEMVAVARNEFDQLVENSLRLKKVQEWGDELIERKLAIPEVEFGRE